MAETEVPPQDTIVVDQRLLYEITCRIVERHLIERRGAVENRETDEVGVEVDVHPLGGGRDGILLPVTDDFELLATQFLEEFIFLSRIREDLAHVSDDIELADDLRQVFHLDTIARDVTSRHAIELHDSTADRHDRLVVLVRVKLTEDIDTREAAVESELPCLFHGRSHLTFHLPHRADRSKPYNKACCEFLMNAQSET